MTIATAIHFETTGAKAKKLNPCSIRKSFAKLNAVALITYGKVNAAKDGKNFVGSKRTTLTTA